MPGSLSAWIPHQLQAWIENAFPISAPTILRVEPVAEIQKRLRSLSSSSFREHCLTVFSSISRDHSGPSGNSNPSFDPKSIIDIAAIGSEAVRRVLGFELYETQLLGGMAMAQGRIIEMQTGEGKTLTAILPGLLFGSTGLGTHIMTVNEYLAERDYQQLREVDACCGMTCGLVRSNQPRSEKKLAYQCDVTYGPGYEFGFDFLRDRLLESSKPIATLGESFRAKQKGICKPQVELVQRPLAYAIVDEADSVLIDEASTPLILSMSGNVPCPNPEVYQLADEVAGRLEESIHYRNASQDRAVFELQWLDQGLRVIHDSNGLKSFDQLDRPILEYMENAVRARKQFARDVDYIVRDNQIQLIDRPTGRILPDRMLRSGLHQAIQARESVTITLESQSNARITRQRCFRQYLLLAGMTGTATPSIAELKKVYQLEVAVIPTHRPCLRSTYAPRIFARRSDKEAALIQSVREIHATGRPILVGTNSIAANRRLAQGVQDQGLPFQVLDGTQDAEEANIVSSAGHRGAITIATNVAGRGTDIQLQKGVAELGGLHVIISEPQPSERVDRQLAGRSARQGDPGSSQLFASAEDEWFTTISSSLAERIRREANDQGECDSSSLIANSIIDLQRRNEALRMQDRIKLSKHDDWLEKLSRDWN